jgi:hypothetical protein
MRGATILTIGLNSTLLLLDDTSVKQFALIMRLFLLLRHCSPAETRFNPIAAHIKEGHS